MSQNGTDDMKRRFHLAAFGLEPSEDGTGVVQKTATPMFVDGDQPLIWEGGEIKINVNRDFERAVRRGLL